MANVKISQLTSLATPDAADLLPVVDSSASSTKRTTVGGVVGIINGDVNVATDGTSTISELPVSKLQDGTARQLLQTNAAGTGVEWTSNVDLPGALNVTGAITAGAGSAAAPSVSVGTADNGLYSSGTDQVAIATNGSGRVYVDAFGKVGISATSPGAYLYVPAVSGTTGLQVYGVDSGGFADVEIKSNGSTGACRLYFSDTAGSLGLIRYSHLTNTLEFTANGVEGFKYDGATFQVNGDTVKIATSKTPASASAAGTAGEVCWDANYIYVCTATDTWKRAALSTW
jgi:hypothetical protein